VNRQANKAHETVFSVASFLSSIGVLAVVIVPAAVLVAAISNGGLSAPALTSAGIGGAICWLAGTLALTATFLGNRFQAPVQGMLVGMLFRMGLPMAALVAVSQSAGLRAMTGLSSTILGVYLVALVVETLLALRMIPPQARTVRVA
jgi:hypothetical protein